MTQPTEPVYRSGFFISAGDVNAEGELGLPQITSALIDTATRHANALGIGNPAMIESGIIAGWVLSRLSIEMENYPHANQECRIETWVEAWNRHFSERSFRIADSDDNTLGYARSIWMGMTTDTHENYGLSHLDLPEECLTTGLVNPIVRQARHRSEIEGAETETIYTFRYCDIDYYRHVNTVSYIRLMLNCFPLEVMDANRVRRLELSFLHEGKYGTPVTVRRKEEDCGTNVFLLNDCGTGTPVMYGRVCLEPR